mgnify:CR=1 FL=1
MESVYLAGKAWLLPAALWLAVGLATVWWAYRGASMDRHIRGACMGLKCLGLLLLLLCLLDPMASQERAKPGAKRPSTRSRGESLSAGNSAATTSSATGTSTSHRASFIRPSAPTINTPSASCKNDLYSACGGCVPI